MKIAITSQGDNLDAPFDLRFGRSAYFIIYDTEKEQYESLQNPAAMAPSGAGIQASQLMASKNVEVVISGDFGPKASQALMDAGIRMVKMNASTVREALERFKRGEHESSSGGGYAGGIPGYGFHDYGYGFPPPPPPWFWGIPKEVEITMLKNAQSFLRWQLDMIEKRLKELEVE